MDPLRSLFRLPGEPLFDRKRLLQMLWPLVIEQFLSVLVGMIDVLMVSSLGEEAMSGVSLVDSVNHLILQVLFALTAGGTVVCAKFIGARDDAGAAKGAAQLLGITAAGMLMLTVVFQAGGRQILGLIFGHVEPAVMESAVVYMRYTSCSFPFLAVYYSVSSVFRAQGNTRISMLASLGMNLLNIVGNALCIYGLHMGIVGVALPTLLSRAAAACAMLVLLQRVENPLRLRSVKLFQPDGSILRDILAIGIPNSVESSLFNLGKLLLQSLVATLGTPSLAAYAVAGNLATYLYLPGNAIGAEITTVVGQCRGAGKPEQAKTYTVLLTLMNYLMLIPICLALILGRHFWVSCYHLSDQAAVLGAGLILAHSAAMILWPVAFNLPYHFRASGRARFTMWVALAAMAFCRLGLAWLFVGLLHRNVLWVWYAMFVDWVLRIVLYVPAFLKQQD